MENLLDAWKEFVRGKRKKPDVQEFHYNLMDNILEIHRELKNKTYQHGGYEHFRISDPKPRDIHKALVRDRLLHHAVYRVLYPFFDRKFITDSYSCRIGKGTHKTMKCFRAFAYQVSKNHTRTAWVLKCDIRKFFASIDHGILKSILTRQINDQNTLWLLGQVIDSFSSGLMGKGLPVRRTQTGLPVRRTQTGLPLGNLTSQLLVNVYLNEFDQFVKHKLQVKYYIRYADDFVILSDDRNSLATRLQSIGVSLRENLKLEMHPNKVFVRTLASGVDFLGFVHFPDHRILRTATKRRMFKRFCENNQSSYIGMLAHGNTQKLQRQLYTFGALPNLAGY